MKTMPRPRSSRPVVPHAPGRFYRILASILVGADRLLSMSFRNRLVDGDGFLNSPADHPVIFCVWHNRLAVCMFAYRTYIRKYRPDRRLAALVSASKDGAFLTAVLEAYHVQPVRGSSSRRGSQALLELTTWAERGFDLAITPDGPRGPRYKVQEGVIGLAQFTGLPILPISFNLSSKLRMRSWDQFQVPLPFTRCEAIVGRRLWVPREATDEEREHLRQTLEREMQANTRD